MAAPLFILHGSRADVASTVATVITAAQGDWTPLILES